MKYNEIVTSGGRICIYRFGSKSIVAKVIHLDLIFSLSSLFDFRSFVFYVHFSFNSCNSRHY